MDQYLAGKIFAYQTTLLVTRILLLIVARNTLSHQGIVHLLESVHSMLETPHSRQQISKYSMKQPHKELYPELLTLCFSLLLFVCLWRYDFNVTQFELLRIFQSSFPSSLLPIIPCALIRALPLGTKPSSFTLRYLWVGTTGNINRSTSIDKTPRETELQLTIIR